MNAHPAKVPASGIKSRTNEHSGLSKTSFAYFTNWGTYGPNNFQPNDIPTTLLTHVLYAFADTDRSTGTVFLTDSYADEMNHYPGDSPNGSGKNLYGCLKQLYKLKLKQRNLKVLLSIGGWTYSQAGHFDFVTNSSARSTFVKSVVRLVEDYGLDGIDLDYEYPSNSAQGQGLADLIKELRSAFDSLRAKQSDSTPFLITAAVAAGSENYAHYKVAQMNDALDYWNLMAYDYAGPWSTLAENQANLYGGQRTGSQTDAAIKWYLANGASPAKINLGMPLYGRAFENTKGLGQPYSGVGPGTIEAGIYTYKVLPLPGARVYENTTDVSSYSYNMAKKELVSFDTVNIVKLKTEYIKSRGLAGSMFWELSGDKVGRDSLIKTAATNLGPLDQTPNHIHYPNSKWDNIRNNMAPSPPSTSGSSTASTSNHNKAPRTSRPVLYPNSTSRTGESQATTAHSHAARGVYDAPLS